MKRLQRKIAEVLAVLVQNVTFDVGDANLCTPRRYRQLYRLNDARFDINVHFAKPVMDESMFEALVAHVRSALSEQILPSEDTVPNRIGALMRGGVSKYTIPEFSRTLIRAAAVVGPTRAADMLFQWVEGRPVRLWEHYVLNGISVEDLLEPYPSLHLAKLPDHTEQIIRLLPFSVRGNDYIGTMYRNKVKLSVEFEATLPPVPSPEDFLEVKPELTSIAVANFSIDQFCQSLSLACNQSVSWQANWRDCGDWEIFRSAWGTSFGARHPGTAIRNVSSEQLEKARGLFPLVQAQGAKAKRLMIALDRWMKSKQSRTIPDQLIDLRIALEALYLPDSSGESRFRVSNHGAWHLGGNFSDRQRHQKILRDAYDLASKVMHAGEVAFSEATRDLLAAAQDLCREGILKRLRDGGEPNWNDLLLGKESDATRDNLNKWQL